MIWFTLALFVVSFIIVALLAPKPEFEDARAQDLDPNNFPRATENAPIPLVLGKVEMSSPNTIWYGDFEARAITERVRTGLFSKKTIKVGYRYFLGLDLALAMGPEVRLREIIMDDEILWSGSTNLTAPTTITINKPSFFGGTKEGGGWVSTGTFYPGSFNLAQQGKDPYLVSRLGANNVPAYSGVSHIVFNKAEIGESASLRKVSFILERYTNALSLPNNGRIGEDMNPAEAMYQVMTDDWSGLGINPLNIDVPSLFAIGQQLFNENNGCSVVVTAERGGERVLNEILRQIDGVAYQDPVSGKIVFKLIRNDYDPDDLPTFDENDIVAVRSFSRTSWDEVFAQVKIAFPQRGKDSEAVAIAQDAAVISMIGRLRSTGLTFPFVYNPALANSLAARELSQLSVPLFRFTLEMNRNAYFLKPGDPIRINWPEYGIENVIVRVQRFDAGALLDGKIVIDCLQDSFAVSDVIFAAPGESIWTPPQVNPVPIVTWQLVEMPAWFSSRVDFPAADGKVLYIPMCRQPGLNSSSFSMLSGTVSGDLETLDPESVVYRGYGVLSAAINAADGQATGFISGQAVFLNSSAGIWSASNSSTDIRNGEGGLIFMNGEWMSFESSLTVGSSTTLSNVRRGLFGTRPRNHSIGVGCYEFSSNLLGSGFVDLNEAQTLYYKLLDEAGGTTQDEREVSQFTQVAGTAADRPVRPAFLQIDGSRSVLIDDAVNKSLTWRARNRLSSQVTFEDDAAQTPDQAETYNVEIFVNGVKNNALSANSVSSPYTIPFSTTSIQSTDVEVRVTSVRTGGNLRQSADYAILRIEMDQP